MLSHSSVETTSRLRRAFSRAAPSEPTTEAGVVASHDQRVEHLAAADRPVRLVPHRREQRGADDVLGRPRVVEQQAEVDVEDAAGVLGPLDVAADPVQRLGDAGSARGRRLLLLLLLLLLADLAVSIGATRRPAARPCVGDGGAGRRAARRRRRSPASTQVSFEPPPWLELTTSEPSGSATRVSPPGSTQTSSPSFTANGRRSTCRGAIVSPIRVGHGRQLHDRLGDPAARVGDAAACAARRAPRRVACGPITRPLPPAPSTGLTTSSSSRSSTSSSAPGSSSRQVSTLGSTGSSPR